MELLRRRVDQPVTEPWRLAVAHHATNGAVRDAQNAGRLQSHHRLAVRVGETREVVQKTERRDRKERTASSIVSTRRMIQREAKAATHSRAEAS